MRESSAGRDFTWEVLKAKDLLREGVELPKATVLPDLRCDICGDGRGAPPARGAGGAFSSPCSSKPSADQMAATLSATPEIPGHSSRDKSSMVGTVAARLRCGGRARP